MPSTSPVLSIVTPTRGNFSQDWLDKLLQVQGEVQFILVYPAGVAVKPIADSRVISLVSPYKGEMMQRFIGLLNATGQFVIALDDDDLIHPQVLPLAQAYFQRFPESWVLRLSKNVIDFRQSEQINRDWDAIPEVQQLDICRKTPETPHPYQNGQFTGLLELPVVPLTKPFNGLALLPFSQRLDNHGYHFENFNNIVWRNDLVQPALVDLAQTTRFWGAITWIPMSGFDRLLGLYVQAQHFQSSQTQTIGHWMPAGEQIRFIDKPAALKPPRFHVISDALLVKRFPQYGYFWNLFFEKLYKVPRTAAKSLKLKLANRPNSQPTLKSPAS